MQSSSDSRPLPNSISLHFIEDLYASYSENPASVPVEWREYFASLDEEVAGAAQKDAVHNGYSASGQNGHHNNGFQIGPSFQPASLFNPTGEYTTTTKALPLKHSEQDARTEDKVLQERVSRLIRAHRVRGHMIAHLDPLDLPRPYLEELDPEYYGFTADDMDRKFSYEIQHYNMYAPEGTGKTQQATLHQIVEQLRTTYCRYIGVQFMHIDDIEVREWLQERMETTQNHIKLSREQQIRILTRLTDAVTFEEFIRRKFVGAKSFSLEGAESLIPLLDLAIEAAGEEGIEEIIMGMAHRGRLNVLANIIGKSPRQIFREFEDKDPDLYLYGGDVKYHLGYINEFETAAGKKVHLSLCFNPSHLEVVNPVAMGRLRAKQDRAGDNRHKRGMCLLIHGDAAFAGEGVVQETLNLSELPGYTVGGTLHVIVNNQIGFTTSPNEARSNMYATDIAKMLQSPIFHVNGEDPESVAQVVKLAMDFRREFQRDVVIDMYGYRRLGHNETDEPAFTQPRMYRAIAARKPVREAYLDRLLKLNEVTREEADEIATRRREYLEQELDEARSENFQRPDRLRGIYGGYLGGEIASQKEPNTGVNRERLSRLLESQTHLPPDFKPHPRILRFLQTRRAMAEGTQPLDWSAAEALAFASLLTDGVTIRFTGQDSERGTFSHRHAVLHDIENDDKYTPLKHLSPDQAPLHLYNSPLSEMGVLGYEYGYSLDCLDGLTLWEAQFGDFWNVAQAMVDQFIASGEDKWHHLSGLVMLLPHGFEGMGPEHSSARLERFLSLAAEDNMLVTYPTTPAQYFHMLRRQVLAKWRKPLIVMSPKSLLRHIECVSTLEECETGAFQTVLPDVFQRPASQIKRILLCTGKIYYELDKQRESLGREDVAILRLEQLYPLPEAQLEAALSQYKKGTPVYWVQEEPENMGAWRYMLVIFGQKMFGRFPFAGIMRPESASPATGSASSHRKEQDLLLSEAFGDAPVDPAAKITSSVGVEG